MRSRLIPLASCFVLLAALLASGNTLRAQEPSAPAATEKEEKAVDPTPPQPAAADEKPDAADEKPAAADEKLDAADEKPDAADEKPDAADEKPAPAAGSEKPTNPPSKPAPEKPSNGRPQPANDSAAPTEPSGRSAKPADSGADAEPSPPPTKPIDMRKYDPKTSFARLAHPAVADRLRLTDEQRAEVARLLTERAQALAKAPEDQWIPIAQANDDKLKAVLTPAQLEGWPEKLDQKLIQCSWYQQPWADVLQLFAEQAELALVLDAPPPGTFTYSDPKAYTPAEAIDLLNGVLHTKGYTLIRRDQMLMVIDLRGGVPKDLVPTVDREDLGERGQNEFVKVEFPLGKKEADRVLESIQPVMGRYATTLHIPAQQTMIVLDTAKNLIPIGRIIDSVPEPKPPKNPLEDKVKEYQQKQKEYEQKQKELENKIKDYERKLESRERPVSEIYELEHASLDPVVETLKKVMGSATIIPDSTTKRLYVFATPSQQEGIKSMIDRLDAETPIDEAPRLESYDVDVLENLERIDPYTRLSGAQKLVATLKQLVPKAEITIDTVNKKLLAFASPSEQDIIRQSVEKLTGETTTAGASSRVAEIYTLETEAPANLDEMIDAIAPGAEISIDAENRRAMVIASPEQHVAIQDIISRLDETAADQDRTIVTYPVSSSQRTRFYSVYRSLYTTPELKGMQMLQSSNTNALVIWATPEQHARLAAILDQFKSPFRQEGGDLSVKLEVHKITTLDGQAAEEVFEELVPDAEITYDARLGGLIIIGTAAEQDAVRGALAQLQTDAPGGPDAPELRFYTVDPKQSAAIAAALEDLVPKAKVTERPESQQIMVVGTAVDHEIVAKTIESFGTAPSTERMLEVYAVTPMQRSRFDRLQSSLEEEIGPIEVLDEERPGELSIYATAAQHEAIAKSIDQLGQTVDASGQESLLMHSLRAADASTLETTLSLLYPDVRVQFDSGTDQLLIWAAPEMLPAIQKSLETIDVPGGPNAPELRFHAVDPKQSKEIVAALRQLVPKADVTERPESKQLMVIATAADHDQVTKTIESFSAAPVAEDTIEIYPVEGGVSDTLLDLLNEAASDAEIEVGPRKETLIVTASADDHATIARTIADLAARLPVEEKDTLKVYSVTPTQRARFDSVLSTIESDVGDFTIINDGHEGQLTLWASPTQHALIAATLEELGQTVTDGQKYELLIHAVRTASASDLEDMLGEMYPDTRIEYESNTNRLIIWSRPDELAAIQKTLESIDAAPDPNVRRSFATYELKAYYGYDYDSRTGSYRAYSLLSDLRALVPGARLSVDRYRQLLMVWGTAEEQKIVAEAIEKGSAAGGQRRVEVYPLTKADPEMTEELLDDMFDDADINFDEGENRLVISASEEEHQEIARVIGKLQPAVDGPNDPILKFYPLKVAPSPLLISGLKTLVPDAEITDDEDAKRLMVIATPSEQNIILDNLYDIQSSLPEASEPSLVVYPVDERQRRRFEAFLESAEDDLDEIRIVDDQTPGAMSVWADLREHQLIGQVLTQLKADAPPEARPRLQAFQITESDLAAVTDVLEDMFPETEFVTDPKTSRILAYASAADLQEIEQAVAQLDAPPSSDTQSRFESFVIPGVNGTSVSSRYLTLAALRENLRSLAPEAKITISADYRQLVVWGLPHELDLVRGAMEQLSSPENTPTVRAYPMMNVDYHVVYSMLNRLAPSAVVSFDYLGGRMVVLASPSDHAVISQMVTELDTNQPAPNAHVLRVYDLKEVPSSLILRGLGQIAPRAEIDVDREEKKLIVTSNESDQRRLLEAVTALNEAAGEPGDRRYETFEIEGLSATSRSSRVLTIQALHGSVRELLPEATILIDDEYQKLIVFGTEDELELARKALSGLGRLETPETAPRIETYDLGLLDPSDTIRLLEDLAEEAVLTRDEGTGRLIALARPEEQAIIKDALDRLNAPDQAGQAKEIRYYSFAEAAPESLVDGLEQLIPNAEFTPESDGLKLMVIASPADHERVAAAIARYEETASAEDRPRFESFELSGVETRSSSSRYFSLRSIQDNMRLLVPGVQLTFDSEYRRLIAFGTPRELEIIRSALEQIMEGTTAENTPRIEIFDLSDMNEPRDTYYLMYRIAPTARMTFDDRSLRLIVWGMPDDLDQIRASLAKMSESEAEAQQAEMQVYSLKQAPSESFLDGLEQLAPKADIEFDEENLQLIVVARAAEQAVIEASLTKLEGEPGAADRRLIAYPIGSADAESLIAMLAEMFPTVKVQEDPRSRRLLIWAKPAEHVAIAEALEQVTGDTSIELVDKFVAYPLQGLSSDTILDIIEKLVPYAEGYVDDAAETLIVYARADEHEMVDDTMEQLRSAETDKKPTLVVYPCGDADPEEVADTIRAMLDEESGASTSRSPYSRYSLYSRYGYGYGMSNTARTVRADRKTKTVVVLATPPQHERIQGAVEALAAAAVGSREPTTKRYALVEMSAYSAINLLSEIVPNAQLSPGAGSYELIAYADAADHAKIQEFADQLQAQGSQDEAYDVRSYILKHGRREMAERVIERLLTGVYVSRGADPNQLLIWARPFSHTRVEKLIAELDQESPPELAPVFKTYPLEYISTTGAVQMLNMVRPGLYINVEREKNALVVWASPVEQEQVQATLEQLDTEKLDEAASTPVLYTLENLSDRNIIYATRLLMRAVPGAIISQGIDPTQFVAFASPKEHRQLETLVEQLSAKSPETTAVMQVYPLTSIDAPTAINLLSDAVPNAELSVGADVSQLVAWARPADHEDIAKAIEAIEAAGPSESAPTMQVYDLTTGDVLSATELLAQVTPDAVVTPGENAKQLVVWARPADHEKIKDAIQKLNDASPEPELKIFTLQKINMLVALSVARGIAPEALCFPGSDPSQMYVWARPGDHEKVQSAIDKLETESTAESAARFEVYALKELDVRMASQILRTAVPEARIVPGEEAYQLLIWARPSEHAKVAELLAQVDVDTTDTDPRTTQRYDLSGMGERGVYYVMRYLREVVPGAEMTLNVVDPTQLVITARPKEHDVLAELVEELTKKDPASTPVIEVYSLETVAADRAITMLQPVAPEASFSVGADPSQLVVWARPTEHEDIKKAVEKLAAGDRATSPTMEIYTIESGDVMGAIALLAPVVPDAELSPGDKADHLVAWARPSDHRKIAETIQKLAAANPKPVMKAYAVRWLHPTAAEGVIATAVPDADVTIDPNKNELMIWATPDEHARIAQTLADLDVEGAEDTRSKAVAYDLSALGPRGSYFGYRLLYQAVPTAQFSSGVDPAELIVWATPQDHDKLAAIVKALTEKRLETTPTLKVHALKTIDASQAIETLSDAFPTVVFSIGSDARQLCVWAKPDDHDDVEQALAALTEADTTQTAPTLKRYTLEEFSYYSLYRILRQLTPQADLLPSPDQSQLLIWASPDDHEKIAKTIETLNQKESAETAPTLQTYALKGVSYEMAIRMLVRVAPTGVYSLGASAQQLVAWARPDDHAKIKDALDRMSDKGPADSIPTMETYTIKTTTADEATLLLESVAPQAQFGYTSDPHQLLVWAIPSDHEEIRKAIDSMSTPKPEDAVRSVKVYSFESAGAVNAQTILQQALPQATFSIGSDPSKLIVWGYPDDHATIEKAMEEIEADSWTQGNRVMSVYPMREEDTTALLQLLDPVLQQNAQFIHDAAREVLIVWANAKHHEAIKQTIEQYVATLPPAVEAESRVYRFQRAQPYSVMSAIARITPTATVSYDYATMSLAITALPEEHKKIAELIGEMDREEPASQRSVRVHRTATADVRDIYTMVRSLYAYRDPQFVMALDSANRAIIALASPDQHTKIDELIAEVEQGALGDPETTVALYSLKNIDSYSAQQIISDIMTSQGIDIDVSIDQMSNQLVAIARPEQHKMIAETLDTLRTEDREVEVFRLDEVDPTTAEMAVYRLFADESYLSAPTVDADEYANLLFMRGTREQIETVRETLIKMGERNLSSSAGGPRGRMRTLRLEGDTTKLLEELKRAWPEMGSNRLEVIRESEATVPPSSGPPASSPPATPPSSSGQTQPSAEASPAPRSEAGAVNPKRPAATASGADAADATEDRTDDVTEPRGRAPLGAPGETGDKGPAGPAAAPESGEPASDAETPVAAPAPRDEASRSADDRPASTEQTADVDTAPAPVAEAADPPSVAGAPVFLLVGEDGSLTLASEDIDALDKIETLLKRLSSRTSFEGRDYSVFRVEHVAASQVVQSMQIILRDRMSTGQARAPRSPYGGFGSRPQMVIVPDDRLNTIYVQGTRSDREEVEGLIKMLDVEQMPGMDMLQPTLVGIKNTQASRVYQLVLQVFQNKLASTRMPGGEGARIGVDPMTNSLVIVAPDGLTEEIRKFAESLDTRIVEEPAERLHIIQLKEANSTRMQQMLQSLLRMSNYPSMSSFSAPAAPTMTRPPTNYGARPR